MPLSLMCLPFAGAGAGLFRPWRNHPNHAFQVTPIQLPGREELLIEDPYTTIDDAAAGCAEKVLAAAEDRPFALFGHSFGAVLAYETARLMAAKGMPLPWHLIISGAAAPGIPRALLNVQSLTDDELTAAVAGLAGYDHEALSDPELRELLVPALRADMEINETYRPVEHPPLPIPISVLRGVNDTLVPRAAAEAWSGHTTASHEVLDMPGGHMFFSEDWPLLWSRIDTILSR